MRYTAVYVARGTGEDKLRAHYDFALQPLLDGSHHRGRRSPVFMEADSHDELIGRYAQLRRMRHADL